MTASVRGWTFGGSATATLVIPASSWTTTPQDGDLLVAFLGHETGNAGADYSTVPTGFTLKGARVQNSEVTHWVYTKVASSESGDYTWVHPTSNGQGGYLVAVQSCDNVNVDLLHQHAQSATSTTIAFTGSTVVADSLLLIGPVTDTAAAETYSIDTGTEHAERDHTGTFLHGAIYSNLVTTVTSYTRTITKTGVARRNAGTMLAIRPATVAAPDSYQKDPRNYRANIFFRPSGEAFQTLGDATTPSEAVTTEAAAETATASLAGQDATVGVSPTSESAALIVAAQDASTAITPTSEAVEFTFAANDATVIVGTAAAAEAAELTVAAQDPSTAVAPTSESAGFTFAAHDATVQTAAAAADPNQAGPQFAAMFLHPDIASFQLAGDATTPVSGAANPNAEAASITFTAETPQPSVAPASESATLTVAGQDATTQVAPTSDTAAFIFAALDATVTTSGSSSPTPSSADLTITAQDPSASVAPHAEAVTFTFSALDATVTTGRLANAECAEFTMVGVDPSAAAAVLAEAATIVLAALDAVITGGEFNATSVSTLTADRTSADTVSTTRTSNATVAGQRTSTSTVSDG